MLQKEKKNPLKRDFYGITVSMVGRRSRLNAFATRTITIMLPYRDVYVTCNYLLFHI